MSGVDESKLFEDLPYQAPQFLSGENSVVAVELKSALAALFESANIAKAYLVRALYPAGTTSVILCLVTINGRPDTEIAQLAGAVFSRMFRGGESMDILFINKQQEAEIRRVCQPFYLRGSTALE